MTTRTEITRPVDAARRLGVTPMVVRAWCPRGLGRKVLGRWRIDEEVLERVLAGEPLPQQRGCGDDPHRQR